MRGSGGRARFWQTAAGVLVALALMAALEQLRMEGTPVAEADLSP